MVVIIKSKETRKTLENIIRPRRDPDIELYVRNEYFEGFFYANTLPNAEIVFYVNEEHDSK